MKKWALVICWVIIIGCSLYILKIKNLPQIKLPKAMQHNTIGELPIVEVADDGDVYIENGDEDLTPQNCPAVVEEECRKAVKAYKYKFSLLDHWDSLFDKYHKKNINKIVEYNKKTGGYEVSCYLKALKICDELYKKQIKAQATAGNFTAKWMIFMDEKYGGWGNMPLEDKAQEIMNKEFDKWAKEKYQ